MEAKYKLNHGSLFHISYRGLSFRFQVNNYIRTCPCTTMEFSAAIEHGTTAVWYGRVFDFPGTIARASQREILLKELREELMYHLHWLQQHNEKIPSLRTVDIIVREEVHNISELGESGGEVALFESDRRVVSHHMMNFLLRLMGYNRKDLLQLIDCIPHKQLTYKPPGKDRSIVDILHHVCNAEEFYKSRLGEEADQKYVECAGMPEQEIDALPILDRLHTVRRACVETLTDVVAEKKDTIFTRSEYTDYPQEKWTAYKVMRRFLEHEREHYYNILEYIDQPRRNVRLLQQKGM